MILCVLGETQTERERRPCGTIRKSQPENPPSPVCLKTSRAPTLPEPGTGRDWHSASLRKRAASPSGTLAKWRTASGLLARRMPAGWLPRWTPIIGRFRSAQLQARPAELITPPKSGIIPLSPPCLFFQGDKRGYSDKFHKRRWNWNMGKAL